MVRWNRAKKSYHLLIFLRPWFSNVIPTSISYVIKAFSLYSTLPVKVDFHVVDPTFCPSWLGSLHATAPYLTTAPSYKQLTLQIPTYAKSWSFSRIVSTEQIYNTPTNILMMIPTNILSYHSNIVSRSHNAVDSNPGTIVSKKTRLSDSHST